MTGSPRQAALALVLATSAFGICFVVWGALAPLAPMLRAAYTLSGTQVGLLVAVPVLLGSLARIPIGMLADRWGGRVVMIGLLLTLIVPAALVGLVGSYGGLLGVGFLIGIAGASFSAGIPFVARWFSPERQGLALGVYGLGNAGTALAAFSMPALVNKLGMSLAFACFIPALLAMALVMGAFAREAPNTTGAAATSPLELARRPALWMLSLFYFVTFGGFVAIALYLPTFLVGQFALEPMDAGARAAGFIALATLVRPLGGLLADRYSGEYVLAAVFAIVALLAIVLAFGPGMIVLTVTFLGLAVAFGFGNGAVFKLVAQFFPGQAGAAAGLVGAAGGIGGFFPPILMGWVKDMTGHYAIGFMLLSEFALSCFIVNLIALKLSRHSPRTL